MPQWTDVISDWWSSTTEDWFTDEGYVEHVYSISRYYYISITTDYYYTAIPNSYHFVTQNSNNYFEA